MKVPSRFTNNYSITIGYNRNKNGGVFGPILAKKVTERQSFRRKGGRVEHVLIEVSKQIVYQ